MQVVDKQVNDLIPYENNPRNNNEAIPEVAKSIESFGFKVPIIVDRNNIVIAGHTRLEAAKMIGIETVPCIVADDLTDEQVRAFRIADNKVSEKATWNFDLLSVELESLYKDGFDVQLTGFEFKDISFGDVLEINELGEKSNNIDYILKIGNKKVLMTKEEHEELLDRLEEYIKNNGVSFGFVKELLFNI